MSQITFFRLLLVTFGLLLMAYQGLTLLFPALTNFQDLHFQSQILYVFLAVTSFFISKNLVNHPNINLYSQWILLFILTKMLISLTLFLIYNKFKAPTSNLFVIPFFINYIAYTTFCVYFMAKIGREKIAKKQFFKQKYKKNANKS